LHTNVSFSISSQFFGLLFLCVFYRSICSSIVQLSYRFLYFYVDLNNRRDRDSFLSLLTLFSWNG